MGVLPRPMSSTESGRALVPSARQTGTVEIRFAGQEVWLRRRPHGIPAPDCFEVIVRQHEPREGQVVVRNLYCSVDPYMRGRMNDGPSYVPPFALDQVMDGGAVGEVEWAEPSSPLSRGDLVLHNLGWREYATADPRAFTPLVRTSGVSPSAYLGALGMPGLTAYVGLLDIANMKSGESVFVSGAAGAVGGMAGQLAKLHGAGRLIGSAGSDQKVDHLLRHLGFDEAFNYHSGDVSDLLAKASHGEGVDVYFDNVGGEHLEAAISALRAHGRVAMCGAISQYNLISPSPGPRNLALVVGKRLRLQGFLVGDHLDRRGDFLQEVAPMVADSRLRVDETVVDGIENMPRAFIEMLKGANIGKMVVRVAERRDPSES